MGAIGAAISGIQGLGSIYEATEKANNLKIQGAYQKQQYEQNAQLAEVEAKESIQRGEGEAAKLGTQVNQLRGSQRAGLAAQGIDVNRDDAAAIQQETAVLGAKDVQQIKANAWREAWGYKTQASQLRQQGEMALKGAQNEARNTYLTGGLNAIGSFSKIPGGLK